MYLFTSSGKCFKMTFVMNWCHTIKVNWTNLSSITRTSKTFPKEIQMLSIKPHIFSLYLNMNTNICGGRLSGSHQKLFHCGNYSSSFRLSGALWEVSALGAWVHVSLCKTQTSDCNAELSWGVGGNWLTRDAHDW